MIRREAGSSQRNAPTCANRIQCARRVARVDQCGSKGLRRARIPAARAARSRGRSTGLKTCVCLCVSTCVRRTPRCCRSEICAAISASISAMQMRPLKRRCGKVASEPGKWPGLGIDESGNPLRRKHRFAVDKNNVAAHAECRRPNGNIDSSFCSVCAGHKRSAGYKAGGVQFHDGAIDTRGQPEIIGVDDKSEAHQVKFINWLRRVLPHQRNPAAAS